MSRPAGDMANEGVDAGRDVTDSMARCLRNRRGAGRPDAGTSCGRECPPAKAHHGGLVPHGLPQQWMSVHQCHRGAVHREGTGRRGPGGVRRRAPVHGCDDRGDLYASITLPSLRLPTHRECLELMTASVGDRCAASRRWRARCPRKENGPGTPGVAQGSEPASPPSLRRAGPPR